MHMAKTNLVLMKMECSEVYYPHSGQRLKIHALSGKDERIPVIRHDFQSPEWEAIARILVKGFYQLNFLPVKLNQSFLIATLFGESEGHRVKDTG